MTVQYVDLAHGTRAGRCQVSRDGLVCLEHGRVWPCPVSELRAQLVGALVLLTAVPGETAEVQSHLERALELFDVIQRSLS